MKQKNKRGVSPIEIIISFILFLGFITFFFMYLNPLKTRTTLTTNEALAGEIKSYASIEMNVVGLKAQSTGCFSIKNPFGANLGTNAFVENEDGTKVAANVQGDSIYIEGGEKFYYVFDNGDVRENSSLENCDNSGYSFSVPSKDVAYSFVKLDEMNESYYSNYSSLKEILKVPAQRDFSVIVFDDSNNRIFDMSRNIPRTQVISSEYPVEILKNNDITTGEIRILSW